MINDSLTQLKEEGYVEKVVKAQLQKTIESIVIDSLREYSEFGKGLKRQVEDLLKINLENLDLPSYNLLIIETIKSHLDSTFHEQGVKRMKEQLDEILLSAKDEYKLSELMKELVNEIEDLNELGFEDVHEMTLIIDRESRFMVQVYFDAESSQSRHECKYWVSIDAKTSVVDSVRIREDGRSKKNFKEFDTRTIMGGFYGLEQTLFKMYARKSKLTLDEDAVELEIPNPEYA